MYGNIQLSDFLRVETRLTGLNCMWAYTDLKVCPCSSEPTQEKMKGHFNHIFRLSQFHQSGIIIRSPRNASKMGFLDSIQELLHYFVF